MFVLLFYLIFLCNLKCAVLFFNWKFKKKRLFLNYSLLLNINNNYKKKTHFFYLILFFLFFLSHHLSKIKRINM